MKINFNKTPESSNEIGGLKVNYAPARRPLAKWRFNLVLLLFLLPFLLYLINFIYNYVVITEPGFVLLKALKVKSPSDGIVKMIKPIGADISTGEVIVVLKNDELEEKYKSYSKKLEFNNKNIMETIKNNRDMLEIALDFYRFRKEEYKGLKKLRNRKLITEHIISNALVKLESAKLAYTNAKDSLENSKMALKETLNDRLDVDELKQKLKSLTIISPVNGTIAIDIAKEGELVKKYDELFVIDLHSKPEMSVFLEPKYAKYAKIGKKVTVIFPNNVKINATVAEVQIRAVKTPVSISSVFQKSSHSIVLSLKLEKEFPKRFMINYLPIKVTFNNFSFEKNRVILYLTNLGYNHFNKTRSIP